MATAAALQKSVPQAFQKAELAIENGEVIRCLFNPTEYTISKTNTWNSAPVTGSSLPKCEFGGGNPRELAVSLLLDVSLLGPDQSVRSVTDKLFQMMEVPAQVAGTAKAAPPFLTFRWGSVNTFKAACTSLTVAFQLFHPTGEPIRADVKLQLKQAETASTATAPSANLPTNPTTHSPQRGMGVHTVQDGDSLPAIAHAVYGDPGRWHDIARHNDVPDPLRLRRGTQLTLPALQD